MQKILKKDNNKAFSLIELAVVILIIGILVAAVTQGGKLVSRAKVTSAKTMTQSSPVSGIDNLSLWLETVTDQSFATNVKSDFTEVLNWLDIQFLSAKKNAVPVTNDVGPFYRESGLKNLPSLHFGTSYDSNGNATTGTESPIKFNNAFFLEDSDYTIFVVEKRDDNKGAAVSSFIDCAADFKLDLPASSSNTKPSAHIVTYAYKDSTSSLYLNGKSVAAQTTNLTASNISSCNIATDYFGNIGEIIMFSKSLEIEELELVHQYLSKKWSIRLK